jgi:hypothetical protein
VLIVLWYPRVEAQLEVVFDGRGTPDSNTLLVDARPKSANVSRNGYAEADTWSMEFDARSLPFDPDLIRGCAAAIFMFSADSLDDRREFAVPANRMILGLCDEASLELGKDGQVIRLEGRDATALLLDQEWDPRLRIPAGRPLDVTVQQIADKAVPPGGRFHFKVIYESDDRPSPPLVGSTRRSTKKQGLWVKPGKTYWDVAYQVALDHGFIAFVRDDTIFVTDPRTQTRKSLEVAPKLAYGRNLLELKVSRKFGKERIPQITIRTTDPKTRQRVEVVYPARHENPKTGLGTTKDETAVYPAPAGVFDETDLRHYAKTLYDTMARAEATYHFETKHLTGLDNGFDLFKLDAGTPVYLGFDPFNAEQMRVLSAAQRAEHIRSLGYSDRLAEFIADHYDRLTQFEEAFYIQEASFGWSNTDGLTISGTAANYSCEVRELAEAA